MIKHSIEHLKISLIFCLYILKYAALSVIFLVWVATYPSGFAAIVHCVNFFSPLHLSSPSGHLLAGKLKQIDFPFGLQLKHCLWDIHLASENAFFLATIGEASFQEKITLHQVEITGNTEILTMAAKDDQLKAHYLLENHHFDLQLQDPLLSFTAKGTPDNHSVSLKSIYEHITLLGNFQGAWQQATNTYLAEIDSLSLQTHNQKPWTLQKPTQFSLTGNSKKRLTSAPFCLSQNNSVLCGSLAYHKDWLIQAKGQDLPLSLIHDWFPHLNVDIWMKRALHTTRLTDTTLDLNLGNRTLHLTAQTQDKGDLTARLRLEGEQNLKGTVHLHLPSLPIIKGSVEADWSLSGTIQEPDFNGTSHFKNLSFPIPKLATTLELASLELSNHHSKHFTIVGQGSMGGPLELSGTVGLSASGPSLSLQVTGQHLTLSNTPEYVVIASPTLHLELEDPILNINGNILIEEATLTSKDTPDIKKASNDIHIHHIKDEHVSANWGELQGDIHLDLGKKTHYQGFGLSTNLEGQLYLHLQPGQIPIADGKLRLIQGKYSYFGKSFDLSKGLLYFSRSPLTNPTLDIEATRTVKKPPVVAGLAISGAIAEPRYRLFSSPSLPEEDIFSYFILGIPSSQTDSVSGDTLLQAASELATYMGASNTQDPQKWLKKILALDDIGVSKRDAPETLRSNQAPGHNSPLDNTEVYLGKQLSKRLYVHYSRGIRDSLNTVKLRYLLGPYLTLEVTSCNQERSGELLFSVDR